MRLPKDLHWKATGKTLGEGGQGKVIEVERVDTDGQTYALKALSSDKPQQAYERFHREIEAIKKLHHPNIIKVIDHSERDADFKYYVMERVNGSETLKKLIDCNKNPYHADPLKALGLFSQLIEVILACETVKVVHRDLSPANILVLPDLSIKVIDFGICQIEGESTITLADEGIGTINYMAPECESGAEGSISSRSDLYSAGKILWSALTNSKAFSRESPAFKSKSMPAMFSDRPQFWHLHHLFEKSIRHNTKDRCSPREMLDLIKKVSNLIASRYVPLEQILDICPLCGFGELTSFSQSHVVFGNPNPPGIEARKCTYCGYLFLLDENRIHESFKRRQTLE